MLRHGTKNKVVYLLLAVVLAITGLGAHADHADLALIFAGLGNVVAVCWFRVLRGLLGTAR